MERELLSLGLCGAALLGCIAVNSSVANSQPARRSFVRALRDFEPNDIQANSSTVSPRQQLSISGSLSQRSDIDNYVFTVNGQAKSLVINTTNNPSRVSYAVLEDRNNNDRRDASDPVILLSSAGKTTPTPVELRGRKRLLMQVFGNQRSSASAYGFRVVASEQRSDLMSVSELGGLWLAQPLGLTIEPLLPAAQSALTFTSKSIWTAAICSPREPLAIAGNRSSTNRTCAESQGRKVK